jgi:hypothetical protein
MISGKRHEFRAGDRDSRFSREFSLQLLAHDQVGRIVPIRPLDVSGRGLGFMVKEQLRIGSIYTLVIGAHRFRIEVAYCNSHLGIEGLYRSGLFLRDADGNLQSACEHTGLLGADSDGGSVIL